MATRQNYIELGKENENLQQQQQNSGHSFDHEDHHRSADELAINSLHNSNTQLDSHSQSSSSPATPTEDKDKDTKSTSLSSFEISDNDNQNSITPLLPSKIASQIILQSDQIICKETDLKYEKIHQNDDNHQGTENNGIIVLKEDEEIIFTKPSSIWPQVLAAISVSLASMIIGISSSYSAPAITSMHAINDPNTTLWVRPDGDEASWIGSLMPLGALIGGIIGGNLVETLGRKRTILSTAIPLILSWLLIALAYHIWMIYLARTIAGICVGIISLSLPVYLAETVQPEVRGTLGLFPTAIGNIGILICFVSGMFLNWMNLAFLGAALSVPFLICMLFIPETPRWYIANGQEENAEKALQWLRGSNADIRYEMNQIKTNHNAAKKYSAKLTDLFGKMYIKPMTVALGLMFLQQFCGINAVIFYSNFIFELTDSEIESDISSIIVAAVNFGATFISILLIDRLGRKALLLISNSLMIVSLGTLAVFFYLHKYNQESVNGLESLALACVMSFVLFFSLGFGPVPWLILGEIFPIRIRGTAAATATSFNWACTFLVTNSFPRVVGLFGPHVAFFGFAIICLIGTPFIILYVPETRGQSLEDIEKNLTRPFRRISSTANLKPFPSNM